MVRLNEKEMLRLVIDAASAIFERPVRPEDDFFGLGGDSVSAVELLVRLERDLGQEIDQAAILFADSFADMAHELSVAV
jgi:acyl carrier protein